MFAAEDADPVIGLIAVQANSTRILSKSELVDAVLRAEGPDGEGVNPEVCGATGKQQSANEIHTRAVTVVGRTERDDGGGHHGGGGGGECGEGLRRTWGRGGDGGHRSSGRRLSWLRSETRGQVKHCVEGATDEGE